MDFRCATSPITSMSAMTTSLRARWSPLASRRRRTCPRRSFPDSARFYASLATDPRVHLVHEESPRLGENPARRSEFSQSRIAADSGRIALVRSNFLIVGTQRTGSTALVRSMTFHPEIACGGEWTQHAPSHRKLWTAEQSLSANFAVLTAPQRRRIELSFGEHTRWLGFKLLFRSSGSLDWSSSLRSCALA